MQILIGEKKLMGDTKDSRPNIFTASGVLTNNCCERVWRHVVRGLGRLVPGLSSVELRADKL